MLYSARNLSKELDIRWDSFYSTLEKTKEQHLGKVVDVVSDDPTIEKDYKFDLVFMHTLLMNLIQRPLVREKLKWVVEQLKGFTEDALSLLRAIDEGYIIINNQKVRIPSKGLPHTGTPLFVVADLAKALGYKSTKNLTKILDDDEKEYSIAKTPGGMQRVVVCDESGLYHAILKSSIPEAQKFRKKVTREMLPAIRREGAYSDPSRFRITEPKMLDRNDYSIKDVADELGVDTDKIKYGMLFLGWTKYKGRVASIPAQDDGYIIGVEVDGDYFIRITNKGLDTLRSKI